MTARFCGRALTSTAARPMRSAGRRTPMLQPVRFPDDVRRGSPAREGAAAIRVSPAGQLSSCARVRPRRGDSLELGAQLCAIGSRQARAPRAGAGEVDARAGHRRTSARGRASVIELLRAALGTLPARRGARNSTWWSSARTSQPGLLRRSLDVPSRDPRRGVIGRPARGRVGCREPDAMRSGHADNGARGRAAREGAAIRPSGVQATQPDCSSLQIWDQVPGS